jgi:hypothetical protein
MLTRDQRVAITGAITRAANAVWGDETGQVIVGSQYVHVFAVRGAQTLLHIEHEWAPEAALKALEFLAWGRAVAPETPEPEPASPETP